MPVLQQLASGIQEDVANGLTDGFVGAIRVFRTQRSRLQLPRNDTGVRRPAISAPAPLLARSVALRFSSRRPIVAVSPKMLRKSRLLGQTRPRNDKRVVFPQPSRGYLRSSRRVLRRAGPAPLTGNAGPAMSNGRPPSLP